MYHVLFLIATIVVSPVWLMSSAASSSSSSSSSSFAQATADRSSSGSSNSLALRVMTTNVCNPAEIQRNPDLFKKFAWSHRKDRIFRQIVDESPDIVGFQEIRNESQGSSVADLWNGLGRHGYEFVTFRNNPSDLSLINVIGYKTSKLALDRQARWWASDTPERFSDSWGNGWGRVSLAAVFHPVIMQSIRGQSIPSPDYSKPPIIYTNIHNGLKHAERMQSNKVHIDQVNKMVGSSDAVAIVAGDFNSFPDDGGAEELALFESAGYQETLKDLKSSDGVPVSGTWVGYSYDRFCCPKDRLGSQLDHVFVRAFSRAKATVTSRAHVNLHRYDGAPEVKAKTETDYLVGENGESLRDTLCSDHVPGIVDLEVNFAS